MISSFGFSLFCWNAPSWGGFACSSSERLASRILYHELLAQPLISPRRAGLDRAERHACSLGYLSLGKSPKIGQVYHLSVRRVEHLECPRHPPRQPRFVYDLLRTIRGIPRGGDVQGPVGYLANPVSALAVEVQCNAARDPVEPGREAAARRVEGVP